MCTPWPIRIKMVDSAILSHNPIEKLVTGGTDLKLFYFVKLLYRNINLKIKVTFKYYQKC